MSCRHARRRMRRAALKADAVILLDRVVALSQNEVGMGGVVMPVTILAEIAEMRMRLAPPPGIKAPIVRTGYTRRKA